MAASVTRRGLMVEVGAALGAVALPAGISRVLAAGATPASAGAPAPILFDPAYFITPARGHGFGQAYFLDMARWSDAMDACLDHIERVVAHVFDRERRL